jgi:hypothetical protein
MHKATLGTILLTRDEASEDANSPPILSYVSRAVAQGKRDIYSMLVVIATYRARVGEGDTVIALHEDWHHDQKNSDTLSYNSWKLLNVSSV